jgi:hypothetical protein
MVKCRVCGKETLITCICGFCPNCISWKTHQGCIDELNKREEEKKNEST